MATYDESVSASVQVAETQAEEHVWVALDTINVIDAELNRQTFFNYLAEIVGVDSSIASVIPLVASDIIDMDAYVTPILVHLANLVEQLVIDGDVSSTAEATVLVSEIAAIQTVNVLAFQFDLTENAGVASAVSVLRDAYFIALDQLTLTDTATPYLTLITSVTDGVTAVDVGASGGTFFEYLHDDVTFFGALSLPDGSFYQTWVTNMHTGAPYQYENYPFNSFTSVGETQLGCTSDGIYELVGNDDAGVEIDAKIKTGLIDFGSNFLKSMYDAYIAYTADNDLYLKVTTSDGHNKTSIVYELKATDDALAENKILLGKGVKSRFWQFEITNTLGADFDIASLDVLPVILTRRR